MNKRTLVLSALLFLLGILTRLPFTSHILYHWDSVQFAIATDQYNILLDQPIRPGYILYVALGKVLNLITHDPQTSFVALSILFTGLAAAGIFLLGKRMFSETTGVVAALFLLASPLVWFFGEITMPHVLEAFFVVLVAYLLYQVLQGDENRVIPAALAFGIAGGVRQTTLLFMMPLALYALRRTRPKMILVGLLVFVAVCLAWFVPMVWLTGGLGSYIKSFVGHNTADFAETSVLMGGGLTGILSNTDKFARYLLFSLNVFFLPPLLLTLLERNKIVGWLKSERVQFLLVWVLPACVFYIVVIMGNQGLLLVFLPGVILLCARCLVLLVQHFSSTVRVLAGATAVLVVLSASVFLVMPETLPVTNTKILSYNTLQIFDNSVQTKVATIRSHFDPQQTVILATQFRHAQYYLPEYHVLWIPALANDASHDRTVHLAYQGRYTPTRWSPALVPETIKNIVFFDQGVTHSIPPMSPTQDILLPNGDHLTAVTRLSTDQTLLGRNFLSLVP